ncbi:Natriuretic peptides A [Bagarius yarrelli]|uniref:Natriuretic peptides A n=1 Tax=Bagarius yarrelli TaxID=175774 RepID=A0A556U237_BAGYA|nr:Natriuretic peptides A [Bagarius yarrelli]
MPDDGCHVFFLLSKTPPENLLQQLEEVLAVEEDTENGVDYEDRNPPLSQSQGSQGREDQAATFNEDSNTDDGFEMQRKHLMDLLLSTRSKNFSGCFGGRLDRIGSSSSLGCNSMKG